MSFDKIIMFIMVAFMLLGAFDHVFLKDKLGYGVKFDEGMATMGVLATAMVGLMCMAPVLGSVLGPLVAPFYKLFGADPSMFAGTILALDMGGFALAKQLTSDPQTAVFAGGLYASMMGVCLTFAIPVAITILQPEDRPYLAKGVMCGLTVIPVAAFIGGLTMGIPAGALIRNLIPAIILSVLLIIGLIKIPDKMMKGFSVFAEIITAIVYISLAIAIFQELTGITIIAGMAPIGEQLEVVGIIAITLAGAYPFVHFIIKTFTNPLKKVGKILKINEIAVSGIVACLANSLPMLDIVKDMDSRGKTVAISFMIPAAFVLGDHLGFAAGQTDMRNYVGALIITKLVGGILAMGVAMLLTPSEESDEEEVIDGKAVRE